VEDTSGRHEPSPFTRGWSRRPWRLPHADKGANAKARKSSRRAPEGGTARRRCSHPRKRERRQRCQRLGRSRRRGKKTPTLLLTSPPGGMRTRQKKAARVSLRSAEAFSSAVKHSVPRSSRTKPKTSCPAQAGPSQEGDVHAVKAAERVENARSTGARKSFRWQKLVERIARLVHRSSARGCGGKNRALAGRKLEALLTRGTSQEKAKRYAAKRSL
jgi:hypothetical protein